MAQVYEPAEFLMLADSTSFFSPGMAQDGWTGREPSSVLARFEKRQKKRISNGSYVLGGRDKNNKVASFYSLLKNSSHVSLSVTGLGIYFAQWLKYLSSVPSKHHQVPII